MFLKNKEAKVIKLTVPLMCRTVIPAKAGIHASPDGFPLRACGNDFAKAGIHAGTTILTEFIF